MNYPYVVLCNMQEHHFESFKEAMDFAMNATKSDEENCTAMLYCRSKKEGMHYKISEMYGVEWLDDKLFMINSLDI